MIAWNIWQCAMKSQWEIITMTAIIYGRLLTADNVLVLAFNALACCLTLTLSVWVIGFHLFSFHGGFSFKLWSGNQGLVTLPFTSLGSTATHDWLGNNCMVDRNMFLFWIVSHAFKFFTNICYFVRHVSNLLYCLLKLQKETQFNKKRKNQQPLVRKTGSSSSRCVQM